MKRSLYLLLNKKNNKMFKNLLDSPFMLVLIQVIMLSCIIAGKQSLGADIFDGVVIIINSFGIIACCNNNINNKPE